MVFALEPWVAWFLTGFNSTKECFESKINSDRDILKNLGMRVLQLSPSFAKHSKSSRLVIVIKAFVREFVSILPIRKHPVIDLTTSTQHLF
jgi:hypothetical protein